MYAPEINQLQQSQQSLDQNHTFIYTLHYELLTQCISNVTMYPSTKSAATGSGTLASLNGIGDINEGYSIHTSSPVLQVSIAGFTASGLEHDDVPLKLATSSPSSSVGYIYDDASIGSSSSLLGYIHDGPSDGSLSVNADSLRSNLDMEYATTRSEDTFTGAPHWVNSHVPHGVYTLSRPAPMNGLSINAGLYRVAADNGGTSPLNSSTGTYLPLTHGPWAAHTNNTLFPADPNASHFQAQTQSQLQLWAYETSPTKQTLAEHFEQAKWEDNSSSCSTTTATPSTTTDVLATYEAVMEDDWHIAAVL
ncbi:hypothetical protein DL98DRAFT_513240 [Cadophora sp. DSE1049]|nr:hypothetical protein DL98DRAFT_513240 [Cadophora sp. DSE1049]